MDRQREIDREAAEQMRRLDEKLTQEGCGEKEREIRLVNFLLRYFTSDMEPARREELFSLFGEEREMPRQSDAAEALWKEGQAIAWEQVSPAIFGVMFQELLCTRDRKEWGAYYTSEENIGRLIGPLFWEDCQRERENCRGKRKKLLALLDRLAQLRFLDPACGCGNFLICIYRLLREMETDILEELYGGGQQILDLSCYGQVSLSQMAGIEREPLQAKLARIGLWLTERQMDRVAAEHLGVMNLPASVIRPVKIRTANALEEDWREVFSPGKGAYIVGNPPFAGARRMTPEQKQDMRRVFGRVPAVGNLDYVTAWYRKAAAFMMGNETRAAFVSTNSICQGEQAALLWQLLKDSFHMEIDFAWRPFVWNNRAGGQAGVHCIIVGFSDRTAGGRGEKKIYDENGGKTAANINAYLAAAPDAAVRARRRPLGKVPPMVFGSMANDGGHLVLSSAEREELLESSPELAPCIRPFLGSEEFIGGGKRYCLWLTQENRALWAENAAVRERLRQVKSFRQSSLRAETRKLAMAPERFGEIRQPQEGHYLLVPRVSSVRRAYIPIGFVAADCIASDAALIVPGGDLALFALLSCRLHMLWVKTVAGRLKSDYRYSASVVYNNFPFPDLEEEQRERLAALGQEILAVRGRYAGHSLAALYDPEKMPTDLKTAHDRLDTAVEEICGCLGEGEEEQVERLFMRYKQMSC